MRINQFSLFCFFFLLGSSHYKEIKLLFECGEDIRGQRGSSLIRIQKIAIQQKYPIYKKGLPLLEKIFFGGFGNISSSSFLFYYYWLICSNTYIRLRIQVVVASPSFGNPSAPAHGPALPAVVSLPTVPYWKLNSIGINNNIFDWFVKLNPFDCKYFCIAIKSARIWVNSSRIDSLAWISDWRLLCKFNISILSNFWDRRFFQFFSC